MKGVGRRFTSWFVGNGHICPLCTYIGGNAAALCVSKYEIKTYKRNTSTYLLVNL